MCIRDRHQRAEGHFLTVVELMRLLDSRQSVVDSVGAGQAAALKADAAQVGIGLDHLFDRLGAHVVLHRQRGLEPIGQQRIIAKRCV